MLNRFRAGWQPQVPPLQLQQKTRMALNVGTLFKDMKGLDAGMKRQRLNELYWDTLASMVEPGISQERMAELNALRKSVLRRLGKEESQRLRGEDRIMKRTNNR